MIEETNAGWRPEYQDLYVGRVDVMAQDRALHPNAVIAGRHLGGRHREGALRREAEGPLRRRRGLEGPARGEGRPPDPRVRRGHRAGTGTPSGVSVRGRHGTHDRHPARRRNRPGDHRRGRRAADRRSAPSSARSTTSAARRSTPTAPRCPTRRSTACARPRRRPARRDRRPEVGLDRPGRPAPRAGPARHPQGARPLREPAPGHADPRALRRQPAQAEMHRAAPTCSSSASSPAASTSARRRARTTSRRDLCAYSTAEIERIARVAFKCRPHQGDERRQGQRARDQPPLARGRPRGRTRRVPGRRARAPARRQRRDAARLAPERAST